jgi:hypothetical protein
VCVCAARPWPRALHRRQRDQPRRHRSRVRGRRGEGLFFKLTPLHDVFFLSFFSKLCGASRAQQRTATSAACARDCDHGHHSFNVDLRRRLLDYDTLNQLGNPPNHHSTHHYISQVPPRGTNKIRQENKSERVKKVERPSSGEVVLVQSNNGGSGGACSCPLR